MRVISPELSSDRLAALRKRQEHLRLSILDEVTRQQKRREREQEKLVGIVGRALLGHAEQTPSFKIMLQQVLASAPVDDKERSFLLARGWLKP